MTDGSAAEGRFRDYEDQLRRLTVSLLAGGVGVVKKGEDEHRLILSVLEKLYFVMMLVVERGDASRAPIGVQILYGKITESTAAILHLLIHGHPGQAVVVLRSHIETFVHLLSLLKQDPLHRAKLFEDFRYVEVHRRLMNSDHVSADDKARYREAYEKVKDWYHPRWPDTWYWEFLKSSDPKRRQGAVSGNASFRELCEYVDHAHYYETLYHLFSAAVHPTPLYEAWLRAPEGHLELGPKFSDHTRTIAGLTAAVSCEAAVALIGFVKPSDTDRFQKFILAIAAKKDCLLSEAESK